MATLSFNRFNPVFQSYGSRVWSVPIGDAFNYTGFSARPTNGGDSAVVNSVRADTRSDGSSNTAISVTLFNTAGLGGSGGSVRLTAIGAHA